MGMPLTVNRGVSPDDIEQMMRSERDGRVRQRLLALKFIAGGQTIPEVAVRLEMAERCLRKWTHRFNREGLPGLRDRPRSGQPPKLAPELAEDFQERVRQGAQEKDGVCALRGLDFQRILGEEYGAKYSLGGVYFLLHRLGFSSLVPRPQHPKADEAAQAEFKKTSSRRR